MPLKTKNTSQSVSNTVRSKSHARTVHSSLPYDGRQPRLASVREAQASGQMPAVLSLAKTWLAAGG